MAGVINKTARQYNLKCMSKEGSRVTCRIAPGVNSVNDEHWDIMSKDPYVRKLKNDGLIDFGKKVDAELEGKKPDTVSKSKKVTMPSDKEKAEAKAEVKEK